MALGIIVSGFINIWMEESVLWEIKWAIRWYLLGPQLLALMILCSMIPSKYTSLLLLIPVFQCLTLDLLATRNYGVRLIETHLLNIGFCNFDLGLFHNAGASLVWIAGCASKSYYWVILCTIDLHLRIRVLLNLGWCHANTTNMVLVVLTLIFRHLYIHTIFWQNETFKFPLEISLSSFVKLLTKCLTLDSVAPMKSIWSFTLLSRLVIKILSLFLYFIIQILNLCIIFFHLSCKIGIFFFEHILGWDEQ